MSNNQTTKEAQRKASMQPMFNNKNTKEGSKQASIHKKTQK
jgi:hypothetical protein